MKTLIAIFLSLHFLTASVVYSSDTPYAYIHQISSRGENVFTIKAAKQWKGAKVEVRSENGEKVIEQKLIKQRLSIDFNNAQKGFYTIRIAKNKQEQLFSYERK